MWAVWLLLALRYNQDILHTRFYLQTGRGLCPWKEPSQPVLFRLMTFLHHPCKPEVALVPSQNSRLNVKAWEIHRLWNRNGGKSVYMWVVNLATWRLIRHVECVLQDFTLHGQYHHLPYKMGKSLMGWAFRKIQCFCSLFMVCPRKR